jgi:hypothetical protein
LFVVTRPTCTGEYLEESSRCMVKTIDVELFAFEMPWLTVVICPSSQLFANVRTLRTEITDLRAQSE